MRIISGTLGGQTFEAPKGHRTHPMSDKMRGAIFGALGDIKHLTLLDAFAGSGGISFEAVSRGASLALAIDSDKNAYRTIRNNIDKLKLNNIKATHANISSWSDNNKDRYFDIVICDPPYDKLNISLLQKLSNHVKSGGVYVLSWPGKLEVPEFKFLEIIKIKSYGDGRLAYYRKI